MEKTEYAAYVALLTFMGEQGLLDDGEYALVAVIRDFTWMNAYDANLHYFIRG